VQRLKLVVVVVVVVVTFFNNNFVNCKAISNYGYKKIHEIKYNISLKTRNFKLGAHTLYEKYYLQTDAFCDLEWRMFWGAPSRRL